MDITKKLPNLYRPFIRLWEVLMAALQGFIKDDCFAKASSLTFYTLLALVPILAVAFGVAKGFGFEIYLQKEIIERLPEQPDLANQLIAFAYSALEQAHIGIIATVGFLSLIWTSIQLLYHVEKSLNEIWEIKYQRSYARQITDYLAILILCPIFFVLSSSFSVYIAAQFAKASDQFSLIKAVSPYLVNLLHLIPIILNWALFSFIYIFMPNTSVGWKSAILAGFFTALTYQVVQWAYIHFQIGVSEYSAIYGGLMALPLFLVWLYLSWQIVFLGAEMTYHLEISSSISHEHYYFTSKKIIGLSISTLCCKAFLKGNPSLTIYQITHEVGAPLRVVRHILADLVGEGILAKDQNDTYLPAKNPEDISIKQVFDALEEKALNFSVRASPQMEGYEKALKEFNELIEKSTVNLSLKDLVANLD